jgi:predicted GNAT superfamily acetyltransferase
MAAPEGRAVDFALRPLRKPEEYRHAEELQREALGAEAALAVPAASLRVAQDHGGIVLGAFVDIYLAGVTASSIGWDGTTLYQRVHVTVVRPEYQNHHVGLRLMALLREEVLRLGLREARWAIDPLHRPSASLSFRRLGARADGLLTNYFGQLSDELGPKDESDRLGVRWPLDEPKVAQRLAGELPSPEDDRRSQASAEALVETEPGESGLRLPTAVVEPEGDLAHLEIPFDLASIRVHEPAAVRRWRHASRDAFRTAFDLGFAVEDIVSVSIAHERRSFYLLRRPRPGETTGDRPPPAGGSPGP